MSPGGDRWRQRVETATVPRTLDELQCCLDQLWSDHDEISDAVRGNVSLAAFEVCTNIIEHAGRGRAVRLVIEVRLTATQLEVLFTDEGHPADVDLNTVSFPIGLVERGRGLAIAKACVDDLSYRRECDANHWRLTHRLPGG